MSNIDSGNTYYSFYDLVTDGPDGLAKYRPSLERYQQQHLLENWADPGTFSDLDTATDAEIAVLFSEYCED
jgi:hypothetical protein